MRRVMLASAVTAGALVLTGGYVAADVYDLVPGVLTREPVAAPSTGSGSAATVAAPDLLPSAAAGSDPLLAGTGSNAPVPTARGLAQAVDAASDDPALADGLGLVVLDGVSGGELTAVSADRPRVPASTAKLLAALAIADTLELDHRMTTSVVSPSAGDLVLVAGGDLLVAPGRGTPGAVVGRAGLADLAGQVARALRREGRTTVRLRLDLSRAPGPLVPPTWNPNDVRDGFAGTVAMLGLSTQRPVAGRTPPANPPAQAAAAFVAQLRAQGIRAVLQPASTWTTAAPAGASTLGSVESATYGEVLHLALAESDNALTENLARQAAAEAGEATAPTGAVASFITAKLTEHAVPTTGLRLLDASGLSPGQAAAPRTLAGVLAVAAKGEVPQLREVVAGLPVAGLSGTVAGRFGEKATRDVVGVPRAKTGTLREGSSLAGTTVDADGRPLAFVVMTDRFPRTYGGTLRARAALDRIVAALTRCGCR